MSRTVHVCAQHQQVPARTWTYLSRIAQRAAVRCASMVQAAWAMLPMAGRLDAEAPATCDRAPTTSGWQTLAVFGADT